MLTVKVNADELAQLRRIDKAAREFMGAMTERGQFKRCNVEFDDLADALYDGKPYSARGEHGKA